jgi:hypothetical protein
MKNILVNGVQPGIAPRESRGKKNFFLNFFVFTRRALQKAPSTIEAEGLLAHGSIMIAYQQLLLLSVI